MTAARNDNFMALPGTKADSTDTHHARERLSDDTAPASSNTSSSASSNASSKSALDALLDEYRARATSEREKGTLFEELTRQFLLHDARFTHQFKEVYLWSEWPERRTGDTGIDLVAIPVRDGEGPVAIQCKFYAMGHRIQKADIDSFLSASGKEPFGRRIVVDTSGAPWGKNAQDAIEGQQIPVSRITLADLRDSDIDWRTYSLGSTQAPKTRERKVPRDHQVRARSAVMAGFEEHNRGTMVMACGTGKTFTALMIAREFVEKEGGTARILFAVPSLALLKQTLDDWAAEADGAFTARAVCSDTKVSSSARNDTAEESAVDLPIPATTDGQRLADSLNANNATEGLQVVFATYQSIEVIHRAQEIAGDDWRDFDLIICDEAHRTTGATLTGKDESAFTKIHSNEFIRRAKTLYMTATPRIFAENAKNRASEKDAILTSMDDQETYGPVFFRLGFDQAVKENLLTDYKVIILTVSEEEVSQHYQAITEMGGELNLDTAAKLTGCWNALAKRKNPGSDVDYGEDRAPMRRAVAFCKDIKASKAVATQFPDLVNGPFGLSDLSNDDASDNLQVECRHVDGTMNAAVRAREMDWLTEGAGTDEVPVCRILTNARCLSEGVDVPTLDAVLFLSPRKSQVDVIQAVGRVMRRAEGKDFGYIILPVAVPSGMAPERALDDNKRFQVVWQVLNPSRPRRALGRGDQLHGAQRPGPGKHHRRAGLPREGEEAGRSTHRQRARWGRGRGWVRHGRRNPRNPGSADAAALGLEGVGVRPDREEGGLVPVLGGLVKGHRDGRGPLHSPHRPAAGRSGAPGRVPGVRGRAARDAEPGRRQRVGGGDAGPAHPDGKALYGWQWNRKTDEQEAEEQ